VESALVAQCVGPNLLRQEAVRATLAALRAELAGPSPTLLERLLVERVALCWLQALQADMVALQSQETPLAQRL
jgi:hypothetical protein